MAKNEQNKIKESGLTYDDYAQLPEDGTRYELAGGKLELMTPSPSPKHQLLSSQIFIALQSCEKEHLIFYAPVDVILSKHEVRQPDIVMIRRGREHMVTERGIEGPPDLVVEVLSPSTALKDRGIKKEVYAYFGIREYWIVDPVHCTIEQFFLGQQDGKNFYGIGHVYGIGDTLTSPLFPCIRLELQTVFSKSI